VITVRFRYMWRTFKPESNFLLEMLRAVLEGPVQVVQSPSSRVDLEICSVFPPHRSRVSSAARFLVSRGLRKPVDWRLVAHTPRKSATADLGVWYTGENIRPPASGWDLTLSFDRTCDAFGPLAPNVYLPLWQLGSDMFGGQSTGFLGVPTRLSELSSSRRSSVEDRAGFCCAFIRNPDPMRIRAIRALSEVGKVDVYGLAGGVEVASKIQVARQYRFVLCFENDLYPGYVTEKISDAWLTGAIPLWWGSDPYVYFNERSMVNLANFPSLCEFVTAVRDLNADPSRMRATGSAPLLLRLPNDSELRRALRQLGLPTIGS